MGLKNGDVVELPESGIGAVFKRGVASLTALGWPECSVRCRRFRYGYFLGELKVAKPYQRVDAGPRTM